MIEDVDFDVSNPEHVRLFFLYLDEPDLSYEVIDEKYKTFLYEEIIKELVEKGVALSIHDPQTRAQLRLNEWQRPFYTFEGFLERTNNTLE